MSLACTKAIALVGITGYLVDVEAHMAQGLPNFTLVGLPDTSLQEARDRVRAACASNGFSINQHRVTINLSPADLPKSGSGFDVAIAMATLAAHGIVEQQAISNLVFVGELALDGRVRSVPGVLPTVMAAAAAGIRRVVVPIANVAEAELVPDVEVVGAEHLVQLIARYSGSDVSIRVADPVVIDEAAVSPPAAAPEAKQHVDLSEIRGQSEARYALEIAAAGGHHILLIGSPGSGKTMLAQRLPTILPDLDDDSALATTAIHSLVTMNHRMQHLMRRPPFENPHHTASAAAIIGGGTGNVRPGAISRAHNGVLFLDEAPEFGNRVLQSLRQPLEHGNVTIARAKTMVHFPAKFQLVMAANPCPCGKAFDPAGTCECPSLARRRYLARLSGPLLDRIDVRVCVANVTRAQLCGAEPGESSAAVRERVVAARLRQRKRLAPFGCRTNADVPGHVLRSVLRLSDEIVGPLNVGVERGLLTARGYDRTLRMGWTVADLAGAEQPTREHVLTAMSLRGNGLAL